MSGILLGNITIVGFFNGILYKSFAHDMYYQDIDSLEDLDASGLPILFTSFGTSDLFGFMNDTDETLLIQSLRRKLLHGYNAVRNAALCRNVTGLMRKHHFSILSEELVDTDGSPLLHLVRECPGTSVQSLTHYVCMPKHIFQQGVHIRYVLFVVSAAEELDST